LRHFTHQCRELGWKADDRGIEAIGRSTGLRAGSTRSDCARPSREPPEVLPR